MMRVMVLVKATEDAEAGVLPTQEQLTEMSSFNEQLAEAGVILAGEGLHPSNRGVRLRYNGRERTVLDFNSRWMNAMGTAGLISLAAKYTVARMLERDDFELRLRERRQRTVRWQH
jgi:tyrosyl-tRNA synthetase